MRNGWLAIGACNGLLAVAAGAFGAHALNRSLPPDLLETFKTAAHYHLVHALAICVVSVAIPQSSARIARAAAFSFLIGILLFSGSLYALALTGVRSFGAITPVGGGAFIAGWGLLAWAAIRPMQRDAAT